MIDVIDPSSMHHDYDDDCGGGGGGRWCRGGSHVWVAENDCSVHTSNRSGAGNKYGYSLDLIYLEKNRNCKCTHWQAGPL